MFLNNRFVMTVKRLWVIRVRVTTNVDIRLLLATYIGCSGDQQDTFMRPRPKQEQQMTAIFERNGSCYYGEKFPLDYCSSPCNSISVVGIMLA
jgi:hypothetical protein